MTQIKKLSEKTINQIAAGEVVDRPISVVKELVENAIDAGATEIQVYIEAGGKNLIRVIDNGFGMNPQDLELCIERHATSKLNEQDINNIQNLGFRGEALPSIGSIANLSILTRQLNSEHAYSISVEGGEKKAIMPASGKVGTTIEVKDLFIYAPVRLKFLRSDALEKTYILTLVQYFALCYPNIHFVLNSDDKLICNYPAENDELKRLGDVLGQRFANNMVPISKESKDLSLKGFIGLPTFLHRNVANQYIFVNGRAVKDKHIYASIKASYANIMAANCYPAIIMHINIDPYEIDVNVHPSKTEVRFRDSNLVRSFIIGAIRECLHNLNAKVSTNIIDEATKIAQKPWYHSEQPLLSETKKELSHLSDNFGSLYHAPSRQTVNNSSLMSFTPKFQKVDVNEAVNNDHYLGNALFQINNTYIISQSIKGLVIVDQHAAHERLVMQKMKDQQNMLKSQQLLIPIVVELGEVLVEHLLSNTNQLTKLGIHIERNGITQVLVRQIPELFAQDEISDLLKEFAEMIIQDGDINVFEQRRDLILSTIACHSSIRAGRKLSLAEMNSLLRAIESTPLASQCNHGRPTFVILETESLAKIFNRT